MLGLPRHPPEPLAPDGTSVEGLQAVLGNLDALVYVSDFATHELLYMNGYGANIWGSVTGRECWRVLQGRDSPCDSCSNHLLIGADGQPCAPHVWEFQNEINKRWYQCRGQIIHWTDGRLARLEIATDITDRKNMELALKKANDKAQRAALQDDLTQLNNRRAFFQFGNQLLKQADRRGAPLVVVMFDLDHFKQINDTYGHEAGDEALRHIGALMTARVRQSDIAARIGGEEFAILLADTDTEAAMEFCQRLMTSIREGALEYQGQSVALTGSFGIASAQEASESLESLLSRADRAMYQAKALGRDQIFCAIPAL